MFGERTAQLRELWELCIWNLLCNYETIVNPVYVQGVVRNCIYLFQKPMQQTKMQMKLILLQRNLKQTGNLINWQ